MFSQRTGWPQEPNRYATAVAEHRRSGRELFDLTESNPTRCGLRYPGLEILKSLVEPAALQYRPDPRGLRSAREAVARYYAERGAASTALDPDRILLTTSTSEAYSFLFRLLCDAGDEVLAPAPSYPLFDYLADLSDVTLKPYELVYDHGWQIDMHSLEQAVSQRTRAVLLVHPNNPTGSFVSEAERAALNTLCAQRGLALVADEVFLDYAHAGAPPSSFAENQAALTFTLSGLSKIAALPQMKVAWIVVSGPDEACAAALQRLEVIADTFLSLNAPLQHALPKLLTLGGQMTEQLLARVRQNLAELDAQLGRQSLASRLTLEGGWYAVLRVPARGSDEDLAVATLQRADVLVHPGHFYDFHQDGYLVLSLIQRSEVFAEGVRRLLKTIST